MPQVSLKHGLAALIVSLALIGCSDPKSQIFDSETGKHITGWLPDQHATYAMSGTTSLGAPVFSTDLCAECHGADLTGGVSGISCTECHMGGPTSVHPSNWEPIYMTHGPSVSANGTAPCSNQYCHGADLTGVANSGPSCDKNAGIGGCHSIPYDSATVICGACHRIPPDGTKFPNLAGKHAKHATSSTASCNICHNGASSYVGDHHDGVINFSFLAAYTPKTGLTPSFNANTKTCTNISCHGGPRTQTATQAAAGQSTVIATPNWYTGMIDVTTQCTSCHVYGTVEFNSYSSGQHYFHVWDPNNGPDTNGQNPKVSCTVCHDASKLAASHFKSLGTSAMEGPASATILTSLNYNSPNPRNCTPTCHGRETW